MIASVTPQSFLRSLSNGVAVSPLLNTLQKEILTDQIGALGTVSTYEQAYPAVRSWWFMMAAHFLRQVPGLQAQVLGPERLNQPLKRPHPRGRILGGEPIESYRDYRFREIVIEARCSVEASHRAGTSPEDLSGLDSSPSCREWDGLYHFRLPSPGLWKQDARARVYIHGRAPLSAYLVYFDGGDQWPFSVATDFSRADVDENDDPQHPLALFARDQWEYEHLDWNPVQRRAVFRILQAGLRTFPEVDQTGDFDGALLEIRNFLVACRSLDFDEIKPIADDLRDLDLKIGWRADFTERFHDFLDAVDLILDTSLSDC